MADTDMIQPEGTQSAENDSAPHSAAADPAELASIQEYPGARPCQVFGHRRVVQRGPVQAHSTAQ
jgi:hypothetical protein